MADVNAAKPDSSTTALKAAAEKQGAKNDAEGAWHDGQIYLFHDRLASPARALFVALHEAGHNGFSTLFGRGVNVPFLDIFASNETVRKAAREKRARNKDMTIPKAVEEVLADMSGRGETAGWMDKLVSWVRGLLKKAGLVDASRISDAEVRQIVSRAMDSLRGDGGTSVFGSAALSRADQIESAAGNNGDFSLTNPDISFSRAPMPAGTWGSPEPTKLDDAIYTMQDKHIDTKRVVEAIRKVSGQIADRFDPYLQEELYHGRSAKGVKDFLDTELIPLAAGYALAPGNHRRNRNLPMGAARAGT
ncbi:MAG: hypothetical protein IPM06_18925 [Rhizobiales bacterium]|nr:hypothetical protein [Hyphomicrobiales bacterium]